MKVVFDTAEYIDFRSQNPDHRRYHQPDENLIPGSVHNAPPCSLILISRKTKSCLFCSDNVTSENSSGTELATLSHWRSNKRRSRRNSFECLVSSPPLTATAASTCPSVHGISERSNEFAEASVPAPGTAQLRADVKF